LYFELDVTAGAMLDQPLPHDDRDLNAAQALGARLSGASDVSSADPLLATLDRYARFERARSEGLSPERSGQIWDAIAARTFLPTNGLHRPPVARQRWRRAVLRMCVGASFVGVLALGWFMYRHARAPLLLAEAGDLPVIHTTSDGSVVTLRPHSRLFQYTGFAGEEQYALEGEAYFDVVRNESRSFKVTADDALISVLGTKFVVSEWEQSVEVYLVSGSVALRHTPSGSAVVLKPGDFGRVHNGGAEVEADAGTEDEALDWVDNELRYVQQPIARVVNELAFHFDIAIDFPAEQLDETISGTIILDSRDSALDQLGVATNCLGIKTGATSFRFEPRR
jgi:ferric-dicitrate binding protein FerR (iron transport regulator)